MQKDLLHMNNELICTVNLSRKTLILIHCFITTKILIQNLTRVLKYVIKYKLTQVLKCLTCPTI